MSNTTFHIRVAAIKDNYANNENSLQFKRELLQLLEDIERAVIMNREANKNTIELIDLFEFVTDLKSNHE